MTSSFSSNLMVFMAIMVASMQLYGTLAQTTHVVGDTMGWTIPQGGATAYTTWASQQTFTVGDILVFNFTNGAHDVAEVSAAAYDPCTSTNPISISTTSPTSLTLTTAGTHYYICTFTSHCQIGQKLTINVSAVATTPPTTPTTPTSPPTAATPPSMAPTTPASPPTTTPTPPSTTPIEPCPPTSSPSSSPSSPPTISSGNATPPPSNGAPSFTVAVSATLLAIGLVFLNY